MARPRKNDFECQKQGKMVTLGVWMNMYNGSAKLESDGGTECQTEQWL